MFTVKAGLCERPEHWEWSSFRRYATGCEGRVEIESEWIARKGRREGCVQPSNCPTQSVTHPRLTPAAALRLFGAENNSARSS
jgi:hypothetical protein